MGKTGNEAVSLHLISMTTAETSRLNSDRVLRLARSEAGQCQLTRFETDHIPIWSQSSNVS